MKKLLIGLGGVIALSLLLTVVVGAVVTTRMRAQREATRAAGAAALEGVIATWREDQKALAGHWLFATVDGPDASSVMHARVPFRPGPDLPGTPLGVPAPIVDTLRSRGADWAKTEAPLDLAGLELGWLAELPRFGVWDVEAEGSPMNVRPFNWTTVPVPEFIGLFPVQKARLLQGLARGDLPAAFAETRALARLCASTELYIGAVVAATMVRNEGQFIEALRARGIDPGVAEPSTAALAEQLHRATWAAPAAFQLMPSVDGLEDDVVVARCAGLAEGLASAHLVRGLLGDHLAARYGRLDAALTSSPCRLKNLRAAWHERSAQPSHEALAALCGEMQAEGELIVCTAPRLWTLLPFARAAVGEVLMSVAAPDWFKRYGPTTQPQP